MSVMKQKRFWKQTEVVEARGGYGVALDGRQIKTPAKAALLIPTRAAAEAVAREWDAQQDKIDPTAMPATRWANSAIDKVAVAQGAVADMLAEYGGSDLLCYRATSPEALIAEQAEAWDGPLDWARRELDAPLVVTQGVLPVDQPGPSLQRLRAALDDYDAFGLAAVHDLVTLSGSLVLGLAVARGALEEDAAWAAARVDETWQARLWGADEEAESAAAKKHGDFRHAAEMLRKLGVLSR